MRMRMLTSLGMRPDLANQWGNSSRAYWIPIVANPVPSFTEPIPGRNRFANPIRRMAEIQASGLFVPILPPDAVAKLRVIDQFNGWTHARDIDCGRRSGVWQTVLASVLLAENA